MVEMATKVVYTLREDKQGLQKQFGCINGILHLFDRRYLLGLHRHSHNPNRLTPGHGENSERGFKNSYKEKKPKKMMIGKNRASVESSRNSFSSSCSSTTFSSFDCSKRLQTEWQLLSEPTSPNLHKNQSPDIRNVVKDSMTRPIRVTKDERVSHVIMTHVDSPRPFTSTKSSQYDRKDRNLPKIQTISSTVKQVKEISRFSCDERESKYTMKSTLKIKEVPRLSLDNKRILKMDSINESRSESGSNKRPSSSGVVARLMGLESLTDPVHEIENVKIKPVFYDKSVSSPKWSRKGDECKHNHGSVSPRVHVNHGSEKPTIKNTKNTPASVYGEMEKRLSSLEFKTSGKDLRALKQILETMQTAKNVLQNKERSLETEKTDQPGSPVVNRTSSRKSTVNRATRTLVKEPAPRTKKVTEERPGSSPRLQRSKNGVDPTSNSSKFEKQSNVKPVVLDLKTRSPKIKPVSPMQNDEPTVELAKITVEKPSPVSVLDAFYTEDVPSPVKTKSAAFNDYENLQDDESECHHVEIDNQIQLLNTVDETSLCKSTNSDHRYITKILLASGFLNDPDSAIQIVQLHPTTRLIKPELFPLLEKTKFSNDIIRRKLIFDSVNEILINKFVVGTGKRRRKHLDGETILKELLSEINNFESRSERCVYDEDDIVKNLVSADVNKKSEDWDTCCNEVPGVVLDIERLIFKDLIDGVVNAEVASRQDRPGRRGRQLFSV